MFNFINYLILEKQKEIRINYNLPLYVLCYCVYTCALFEHSIEARALIVVVDEQCRFYRGLWPLNFQRYLQSFDLCGSTRLVVFVPRFTYVGVDVHVGTRHDVVAVHDAHELAVVLRRHPCHRQVRAMYVLHVLPVTTNKVRHILIHLNPFLRIKYFQTCIIK